MAEKVNPKIESGWFIALQPEFESEYFLALKKFLIEEKAAGKTVYPPGKEIFNAFDLCPFEKVKCVILGQDPYHGPNQAHGLSFSVKNGIKPPPSLVNIFKELKSDLGIDIPSHGNLTQWAKQGVLLLNATLTVEKKKPGSHQRKGWEEFTNAAIRVLSEKKDHLVFMLWGRFAQSKAELISKEKHLILQAAHPSPFSAHNGFFGCRHFSQCNIYLKKQGKTEINWKID